jgi:ZIP family zinc transporter
MINIWIPIIMSLIAGLATGIGGAIGLVKRISMRQFDTLIGFAAGVMLAVATLGLIEESMVLIEDIEVFIVAGIVIGGVIMGILFLLVLDKVLPHLHLGGQCEEEKGKYENMACTRECQCPEKDKWFKCPYLKEGVCTIQGGCFCPRKIEYQKRMKNSGLLLAIGLTLHNAPEGIAVGVGFLAPGSFLGFSMAIAIALHNIPEGIAVSLPLIQGNYTKKKAFLISLLSGLAEPISCFIAVIFLQAVPPIVLAFFLAFAGGAMIYITSDELIPESHKHGFEHEATIGLMFGFILMLILIIGFGI